MEKIDIHNSDETYTKCLGVMRKQLPKVNANLIEEYLEASAIGKTQKQKKQAGLRVRIRNLYLLKTIALYLKKPLDKITEKEMEKFIKDLNENKLHKQNGEAYSEQVKANLKIVYVSFLRWALKENAEFHKLTSWISTAFKKKEVMELSEDEVKEMLKKCVTPWQKVLIAVMFDSGARIEEFLNIRVEDLTEVKSDVPYFKVQIRNEFSKTDGRVVSLLWRETTPILRGWLEECPNKDKMQAQLFPSTYDGVRKTLTKIGKRALKKNVNPHLFRHSSATYYAGRGVDYFQLCKRYGWRVGSDVPNNYIHKSGIKDKEVVEKFKRETIEDLEKEIDRFKESDKQKTDQVLELGKNVEKSDMRLDFLYDLITNNPEAVKAFAKKDREKLLQFAKLK
jgi:integrase